MRHDSIANREESRQHQQERGEYLMFIFKYQNKHLKLGSVKITSDNSSTYSVKGSASQSNLIYFNIEKNCIFYYYFLSKCNFEQLPSLMKLNIS